MDEVKGLYKLLPYVIPVWLILNILGNTIKLSFNINSKNIVWILLLISILIFIMFFGLNFESVFVAFVTYSFSVSSYDLVKNLKMIRKKR